MNPPVKEYYTVIDEGKNGQYAYQDLGHLQHSDIPRRSCLKNSKMEAEKYALSLNNMMARRIEELERELVQYADPMYWIKHWNANITDPLAVTYISRAQARLPELKKVKQEMRLVVMKLSLTYP